MPESDRSRVLATVAIFALVVLSLALVAFAYSEYQRGSHEYQAYNAKTYSDQRKSADEISSKCAVADAPVGIVSQCLAEEIAAYQHQDATDKDLKAQQDMADWALWTALAAWVGIPVSIVGLFAIFASLRHTRKAISSDRENAIADRRPWLSVSISHIAVKVEEGLVWAHVEVLAENLGRTPALDVDIDVKLLVRRNGVLNAGSEAINFYDDRLVAERRMLPVVLPNSAIGEGIITHTPPDQRGFEMIRSNDIQIAACVTYSYLGAERIGQTAMVFAISKKEKPIDYAPVRGFESAWLGKTDQPAFNGRAI